MKLEALLRAVDADAAPEVEAGPGAAATIAALDALTRDATPALVVVTGDDAVAHARAWAADRSGWLTLDDPPAGVAVVAPVATLARDPMPPGVWRGAEPTARASELARASSARAALVDSQRLEVDRLRAELIEQRAWVASEVQRVQATQAWRLGHRLVRTARRLTFRRDHGTDALQRIVDRMNEPVER